MKFRNYNLKLSNKKNKRPWIRSLVYQKLITIQDLAGYHFGQRFFADLIKLMFQ